MKDPPGHVAVNFRKIARSQAREAEKFRAADSTRAKEWLEIEKVRPIGFIGKDILAIEKKITDPGEIMKQNQGFEISRLLNQQQEQEQHPGIDR